MADDFWITGHEHWLELMCKAFAHNPFGGFAYGYAVASTWRNLRQQRFKEARRG